MLKVGAVILAAGGSSRFGEPKQLLTFHGETLVRRAMRVATEAGCSPVVVVVGESGPAIREELRETSAVVVENPKWQRGLGTSIRTGVDYLSDSTDAVVLLTCDQPLLDSTIVADLIAQHERTGKPIVASRYANTLGVPALFDRSCFAALLSLPDDSGAKSLIAARSDEVASVPFEEGAIDIDTREDFQRLTTRSE
jgi:molybdenum cofactor cytidylyltransferase